MKRNRILFYEEESSKIEGKSEFLRMSVAYCQLCLICAFSGLDSLAIR